MEYTRNVIIEKCKRAFDDIRSFYQADFVNYRGKTCDTDEYYTEVIAEFLCENIETFMNGIPKITRKNSYKTFSHDGKFNEKSNRLEEIIAMQMYNQSKNGEGYSFIGDMIDYQTPLKSSRNDIAGKIDLLAYNGDTLFILELKKPDSEETMLRCVLEGYTYLKTADLEKLISDFCLPPNTKAVACPFVFKCRAQHQEMRESRPNLKKLMALLQSKPYYISLENEKYTISEG